MPPDAGTLSERVSSVRPTDWETGIIGLGYVGATLAVALADAGTGVFGYDARPDVRRAIRSGCMHIREPGLEETLRSVLGHTLRVVDELPEPLPRDIVIAVGTPVDANGRPDLTAVRAVTEALATRIDDDTLVVLRSTVPVGTCRTVVHATLAGHVREPLVAYCPERTIQGIALEELRRLPQVISGSSDGARDRAAALFERLSPRIVSVSSLEAAEMVKLVCNSHTDLLYGFGNEVAFMAEVLGLDAAEIIRSANLDYPRPDLARPGFVGGSCLTKDPYILMHSVEARGYTPPMVAAARSVNENVVLHTGDRVLAHLRRVHADHLGKCVVTLCGIAYKGAPETDDVRGAAAPILAEQLRPHVGELRGHDFVLSDGAVEAIGVRPAGDLDRALANADAAIVLNDHPRYGERGFRVAAEGMRRPALVFDVCGFAERPLLPLPDRLTYRKLGRG